MTKRIHRLLSLLLSLLLIAPAARAAGDKVIGIEGRDGFTGGSVYDTCVIGNEVWMQTASDLAVYDAQTGETAHYPWSDECNAQIPQVQDGVKHWRSIERLFAWRGEAYVLLSSSRSGQDFYEYDGVSLQRVVIADGQAGLEEVGPVDWEPLDQDGYVQIERCLAIGDTLYAQYYGDMGDFALAAIPLDGSRTTVVPSRAGEGCGLCLYEGELLALVYDYDHRVTYFDLLDLESLTFRELGRLEGRRSLYCPAQEKDGTRVLVTDMKNSQVIAWDPSNGQTQEIAPLSLNVNQAQGFLTDSGVYVAGNYEGVALIPTADRVQVETELVVCDGGYEDVVDKVLLAFLENHPEVAVRKTQGAENVLEQLMTRTGDVDIYIMSLSNTPGDVAAIMNRQWGAPMDSEVITAYVADMYPSIAQACTGEDGVFMVPLSARVIGQSIGRAALEALNLTIEDVPTSWPEFLDFLGRLAEAEGNVPLADWSSTEEAYVNLAQRILNTYQLTIQAGINQDYDTPELRAALEALDRLDLEQIVAQSGDLYANSEDEEGWQDNPLLYTYEDCAVDGDTFHDSYPMMLSMTADRPASLPVSGAIAIINPASEHIEEATAFLEECVGQINQATRATLSPHQGEPTRSADFETRKEQQRQQVESLEAQLAQAKEIDKPVIQQDLDSAKRWYDEMDYYYWDISPQSLEWYRAHDDDVRLNVNADLADMRLYSLLSQLAASGEGRTDALIAELQRQAVMSRLEQEG